LYTQPLTATEVLTGAIQAAKKDTTAQIEATMKKTDTITAARMLKRRSS
jgi:hypothetical protein